MRQHHWNMFCCIEKHSLFLLTCPCYQLTSTSSIEGLWISRKSAWIHGICHHDDYPIQKAEWAITAVLTMAGQVNRQHKQKTQHWCPGTSCCCLQAAQLPSCLDVGRAAECKPMGCVELPHAGERDLIGRAGIAVTSETASSVHAAAFENRSVDVNVSALHLACSPEAAGTGKHEYVELQIEATYRANLTCSVDWQSVVGDWSGRKALTARWCGKEEDNPVLPIPKHEVLSVWEAEEFCAKAGCWIFFFFFLIHDARKQPQYAVDSHPLWKYCLMSTGNKGFILHLAV